MNIQRKLTTTLLCVMLLLIGFNCTSKVKQVSQSNDVETKETPEINLTPNTFVPKDSLLFNHQLIGLGIRDSSATDIFQRYWVDFYYTCYPSSYYLYIDSMSNKIFVYDFPSDNLSDDEFSVDMVQVRLIFHITNIHKDGKSLSFKIHKVDEMWNENTESKELSETQFILTCSSDIPTYELKILGNNSYNNTLRYNIFTLLSKSKAFEYEDCGDFDG